MGIVSALTVFLAVQNTVQGLFEAETQVLSTCAIAGGFTGILTHIIKESTSTEEEDAMSDPCIGNECGNNGQCLSTFCNCQSGFCGANCERSVQETGFACPCQIKFSSCVENTCVCDCGFTFNPVFDLCMKDCARGFADTFTLFDGKGIRTFPFRNFIPGGNLEDTRTACNNACLESQNPVCRSYVVNTNSLRCVLFSLSKDDVGLFNDNIFETYERDCIDEMS